MPSDLPDRLRIATRDLHCAAERTALMAGLLGGRVEPGTYCALLRNLHAIYAALEAAIGRPDAAPAVARFDLPPLRRSAAIGSDLAQLHGPRWLTEIDVRPAADEYVQRLQRLGCEASPGLIAHAYVRYLGDLHGGQLLKRRVVQALGLHDNGAVSFYDFGPAEQVQSLRRQFRDTLGSLPLTPAENTRIVDEARWAFEQHLRLFEQLQPSA